MHLGHVVPRKFPELYMFTSHVFTILGLGFLLGVRHAFDADHLAAVSTVVAERPTLRASSVVGLFWGLGHTLVLLLVGMVVLAWNVAIPESFATMCEFAVGIMLIVLGAGLALRIRRNRWHVHTHEHEGTAHVHLHHHGTHGNHRHVHWFREARRPLLIGMAHGLAGSAALLLIVVSTAATFSEGVGYILIFGLGLIAGMMGIGAAMSFPVIFSISFGRRAYLTIQGLASAGSIGFGLLMMWRISRGEPVF